MAVTIPTAPACIPVPKAGRVIARSALGPMRHEIRTPMTVTPIPTGVGTTSTIPPGLGIGMYAEAGEELLIGQPVRYSSAGLLLKAGASELITRPLGCIGLVLHAAASPTPCLYTSEGTVQRADWRPVAGALELVPGSSYYLGSAPGTLTAVVPTSGILMLVGIAVTTTKLDIQLGTPIILA